MYGFFKPLYYSFKFNAIYKLRSTEPLYRLHVQKAGTLLKRLLSNQSLKSLTIVATKNKTYTRIYGTICTNH